MTETGKILQQRYRIDKQIGQGGMGAVYVATDERFGSTVAIKETLCMDDNYRKAIEREARLLNSLKHTALPRVSDHFVEDDGQFLVMEFIPGEDLFCILEAEGKPFPVEKVLLWADQLLDALDFLHNQKDPVIHRDIKPQNLKITAKGQIILLDFGLAKGNPTDSNNKTAAKSIFGYSRNYASLEQIQGTGTDPRSDLYSLAATLYHIATGTPPEDALTRAMAVLSNRPDPLIPAHLANDTIPRGVAAILQKAMDLNADERPVSASEMRSMLRRHEEHAYLAPDELPEAPASHLPFFTQKTKLMPEVTVGGKSASEVVTALIDDASQVTAVRPTGDVAKVGDGSVPAGSTRRFTVATAGLGTLLFVGGVVGAVFMYDPGVMEIPAVVETGIETAPAIETTEVPAGNSMEAIGNDTTGPATTTSTSTEAAKQASERRSPGPDPKRTAPAGRETADAGETGGSHRQVYDTPDGKLVIEGNTVYLDGKKISGNTLETSEGTFVFKKPPIPPEVFQMEKRLSSDMQHMTPEQRRKLIRAMRRIDANVPMRPVVPDEQP